MFPPKGKPLFLHPKDLFVMSLPYNLMGADAPPLSISHDTFWDTQLGKFHPTCCQRSAFRVPSVIRWILIDTLVAQWSKWHLTWFVMPHAVPQFLWFSAKPLHHPELCHAKGLQAPKTSDPWRTGRDMLSFAFGDTDTLPWHILKSSPKASAHLFICILASSFQWFSQHPHWRTRFNGMLSFLCLCLRIEAFWSYLFLVWCRLPMLQLLLAPPCPAMACIWCIAFGPLSFGSTFAYCAYYYVCTWQLGRLYRSQASHRVQ